MDLVRIIIAILLPPLGVFLQVGLGKQFWINILMSNPLAHTVSLQ
ncbi:MAG TPA: YqaE/Pmp3 family membrane protein [Rubrobacteraceae bacterium]|nr:YqaE/Pmp3 family membrane protein [Rubrobacteraceae bacterium]